MNEADLKIFSHFLGYFQKETDRGAALVGAAMIESRLERILSLTLKDNSSKKDIFDGPNSLLGTFSSKIRLCHLLGFITEKEFTEINIIRKIRNEFAHKLDDMTFGNSPVCDHCMNLQANTPGDLKAKKDYRFLFINSVIFTSMALWYRPEHINQNFKLLDAAYNYQL